MLWLCLPGGALVFGLLLWFFGGRFWLLCREREEGNGLLLGGIQLGEEGQRVFVSQP